MILKGNTWLIIRRPLKAARSATQPSRSAGRPFMHSTIRFPMAWAMYYLSNLAGTSSSLADCTLNTGELVISSPRLCKSRKSYIHTKLIEKH